MTPRFTTTAVTPGTAETAAVTSRFSCSRIGQAGDGQQNADAHSTVRSDVHRLDHVEFGDRPADLGVENSGKSGVNRLRARMGHMSIVRSVTPRTRQVRAGDHLGCRGMSTARASLRPSDWRIEVWRSFLRAHSQVVRRLERDLTAEAGLPLAWYDVLLQLAGGAGPAAAHG